MPETWASSGVDLHLDRTGPRLRASLEDQLREAVRSGRLAPGLRLPSSRSLAGDLGVARNTVVDVYALLVAEGWLVARQGSVTRVAGRTPAAEAAPARGGVRRRLRYDLRPGSPDVAAFPRSRWLAAARRALNTAPAEAFGDAPDARGRPELHQALAGYLARARGVRVSPDRIVVCSGFTQGLGLICRVLHARGATTLAMEEYGLPDLRGIAAGHGLRTRLVPVDQGGAVLGTGGPGHPGSTGSAYATPPEHAFTGTVARLVAVLTGGRPDPGQVGRARPGQQVAQRRDGVLRAGQPFFRTTSASATGRSSALS
jgi:GntR family transcriptional regulator/MocR family aminotransferase